MLSKALDYLGVPHKVAYQLTSLAISAGFAALKYRYPGLELPSPDLVIGIGGATIVGHTATDIAAILKSKPQ